MVVLPPSPLLLCGTPIERVECFKYLGLLLPMQIPFLVPPHNICLYYIYKAKKILGLHTVLQVTTMQVD